MGSTDYADLAVTVLFGVITLLALASLVLPFALRTSRLMWVVIVCGGALALVSSRVAITVDADGVVAGSAQPGIAMMILGFLACVCLVAGGAVKRFQPLHASGSDPASKKDRLHVLIVSGRVVLALILVCCIGINACMASNVIRMRDWACLKTACPWSPPIIWRPVPIIVCLP